MKLICILGCVLTFAVLITQCSGDARTVSLGARTLSEPTPTPNLVRKDAEGNLIKDDGWEIQHIVPKQTERSWSKGKTRGGRTVRVRVVTLQPESPVLATGLPPHSIGSLEWRITEASELSGTAGKIFCYQYAARPFDKDIVGNGVASITRYRLCDYDGDGKFEFNGWGFNTLVVPDWIK